MKRAMDAKQAGFSGVVCSALEVNRLKQTLGQAFIAVTPGIRPDWQGVEDADQRRVMTPAMAISQGSDYLVIGRPIRDAADPRAAAQRIAEEIEPAIEVH
jgi:orotidine-5'-phosphate decarboxylase